MNLTKETTINKLLANKKLILPYTIGALLYTPATSKKVASSIIHTKINDSYSLALCLEDSIHDDSVQMAEEQIITTFKQLSQAADEKSTFHLPNLFIRVRRPEQVSRLFHKLETYSSLLTGFIFPKYSLHCCKEYSDAILSVNQESKHTIYMMPILESSDIITLNTRYDTLDQLKSQIDSMSDYVLNVRVGGNDFCKEFGFRRHYDETIYEIQAISHILSDIITTFSKEYVVSGPVWEYFGSENSEWKDGLRKELKYDKLNGFIGKTVIHPKQISIVNDSLKVHKKDYTDAYDILSWSDKAPLLVSKNNSGERMNELKTHIKWAEKTLILANIYGVV